MPEEYRTLMLIKNVDLVIDADRGWPTIVGNFTSDDGGGYGGLGYFVDMDFVKSFLAVFGADRFSQVHNKSCWFVFDKRADRNSLGNLKRIDPLHKRTGTPFEIRLDTLKAKV